MASGLHERRDVQPLVAALTDGFAVVADRHDIGMAVAEGIVDLIDDGADPVVGRHDEVQADGIENETQYARHGQQEDAVAIGPRVARQQHCNHAITQRAGLVGLVRAVVAVVEAEQVEPVVRKEPDGLEVFVHAVEVEQHLEDAIGQPVRLRLKPLMDHFTRVKTRFHYSAA